MKFVSVQQHTALCEGHVRGMDERGGRSRRGVGGEGEGERGMRTRGISRIKGRCNVGWKREKRRRGDEKRTREG